MARYSHPMPDIGEGITEAEIVTWQKQVGDRVEEDEEVVEGRFVDRRLEREGFRHPFLQEELDGQKIRQQKAERAMNEQIKKLTRDRERLFEANQRLKAKRSSSNPGPLLPKLLEKAP